MRSCARDFTHSVDWALRVLKCYEQNLSLCALIVSEEQAWNSTRYGSVTLLKTAESKRQKRIAIDLYII